MNAYSFLCSSCGKCCNSPPQLSVPELFHHQHRFIGCLSIRRIRRPRAGQEVGLGADAYRFGDADVQAYAELADALLFRLPARDQGGFDLAIAGQGFDYNSSTRCPVLGEDGRCEIHGNRKPATCAVVPMDALVPDRMQHLVLAGRNTADHFLDVGCIVRGPQDGFAYVTRQQSVVDPSFAAALARRRTDLAADKFWWGNRVFQLLRSDLFSSAAFSARVPVDAFLSISLEPVLLILAAASDSCRQRCFAYIDAQRALIDRTVAQALLRKLPSDKPATRQLRAWGAAYQSLRRSLESGTASVGNAGDRQGSIEAWLNGRVIAAETDPEGQHPASR
jgi:Fe-S-cluster containining protein